MSELKRQLRDLAADEGPPSRLSAHEVYAEAFRRRHRRATAWAAGAVVGVVLVGAMGVTTARAPGGSPVTAPHPAQSADGWPAETHDGTIISAAATDATHLYAGIAACPWQGQVRHCTARLVGSDDAGRTWTVRQADFGDGRVTAPAPGVLLRTIEDVASPPPKIEYETRLSTDGGRTWRVLRSSPDPVAEVPAGGWVQCAEPSVQVCTLLAVDPATALAAPLASQPALTIDAPAQVPVSAGVWVTGRDPDDRSRPAVAVSHDRGRTWSTHVFGREEMPSAYRSAVPHSVDGSTAYTVVSGSKPTVFRSIDGGRSWQPGPETLPSSAGADGDGFVAADGTHIVLGTTNPPWLWYAGTAGGYRTVDLPGLDDRLPPARALVRVTAPGVYVAFDNAAVYRSSDGLRWTRTVIHLPPS
ncbi:hypothetical protein AB0J74_31025 [Asanoa sp. NPDC049573]|uniref:hypothetical protein n=1 Tax=Asanoa sp. NPDC049573 TaxID=3155396 RepID=UPI0034136E15